MRTNRTYVQSFVKQSKQSPWVVSVASPFNQNLIPVSIGNGGEVEAGPRLNEVLSIMERRIDAYPFQFTYHKVELIDANDYNAKVLGDFVVYLEAGVDTYRALIGRDFLRYGTISFTSAITERMPYDQDTGEVSFSAQMVTQHDGGNAGGGSNASMYGTIGDTNYLVVVEGATKDIVVDGDTIKVRPTGVGSIAGETIEVEKEIRIRYVGIDTPETNSNQSERDKDNASYARRYGITLDEAYEVGKEAKKYIEDSVHNKTVVIDLDTDQEGKLATDKHGRYIGVVYILTGTTDDVLSNAVRYGVNLNKTLLATKSKKSITAPLAQPYDYYIDEVGYRRFNVVSWLYELGIREMRVDMDKDIKDIEIDLGYGKEPTTTIVDSGTVEVKHTESPDNRLEFLKPYDDRQEDLYGEDLIDSRVRIGDVALIIPPLSIQTNRVSTLEKVKTLRSKSSIITKTTGSTTTISLQLYFHDLDSINGHAWDNGHGMTYFMDGLRPLIAQFKKAPFLPIDNEYINGTLGIHDVALVSLNISTVPGFPNSISATLILAKFEVASYMPHVVSLGDAINYPLLRWFYQETMKKSDSPYRTYLKPITEQLSNDFVFSLADEAQLLERKTAIEEMRKMDTPTVIKSKIENRETEIGKLISDGEGAQIALRQYEGYQEARRLGLVPVLADERGKLEKARDEITLTTNLEAWRLIYGEKDAIKLGKDMATYFPAETSAFQSLIDIRQNVTNSVWSLGKAKDVFHYGEKKEAFANSRTSGVFLLKLYSGSNILDYPSGFHVPELSTDEYVTVIIPGTYVDMLSRAITRGYEAMSTAHEKIDEYHEAKQFIENTEGNLDMLDFPIEGILPISLNVVYENSVVPIQMQQNDSPTLQYLGSQDPYIEVQFEATQDAVERIKDLLNEAERYAMEYRLGITSGFLGISNQLTELFGVTTVMPEATTITTAEGFPGRFLINMVFCGFDKTQKRMETLEGISPIYGDVDKEDRRQKNIELSRDLAVIEHKMRQLEVYPDMELPEFSELEAVLPKLGLGDSLEYYYNRNNTRFVDPDFYVATDWTFREFIREEHSKDHVMEFNDFAGLKMFTSRKSNEPIEPSDEATLDLLSQLDSQTVSVGGSFGEGRNSIGNQRVVTGQYGQPINSPADITAIKEWLDSEEVKKPPTAQEWQDWGLGSLNHPTGIATYYAWLENMIPEEHEVYREIYASIDEWWGSLVYNDKGETGQAWKTATYGTVDDIWRANYNVMASSNPNLVSDSVEEGSIKADDYKKFRPITRERLANYIKSLIYVQSRWEHYRPDHKPRTNFDKDKGTYHAGIGMIDIAAHAKDTSMAKRLLWDWKFALDYTIEYLYRIYIEAGSKIEEPKFSSRPWDWMIHGFGAGGFADEVENFYFKSVISVFDNRFNDYSSIYSGSKSRVSSQIARVREGLTDEQYRVVTGDKDTLIKVLERVGMKEKELKKLRKATKAEVMKAFEKYMKRHYGTAFSEETLKANVAYMTEIEGAAEQLLENRGADEQLWEAYLAYTDIRDIAAEAQNKLLNDVHPQTLFEEMFTDMIDYDMRGRLARAFPTFQMFIIDEGRWMANYRLWDNLYGFNAIQSIDVHKSRQIAADTAVITMTNVYSNLTSRPMSDGYDDFEYSFWDNLVMGRPTQQIIEARQELLDSMLLQTGARIHLRMGYGSSATHLPVVFNGTITELDTSEVVTLIAQGDGLELTSVISADPDDKNRNWLGMVTEPRDLLCGLMTSKGNWFKDAINDMSSGEIFKDNPLGIQHFGTPAQTPKGNIWWSNKNYGEAAQNIYSSNGANTFSQWVYDRTGDGDDTGKERIPFSWDGYFPNFQPGDEDNILLSLYGQTTWDIAQTIAYCSPDYIAAVHPYELRSTLFFGKPYWRMAYKYDSHYDWNKEEEQWERTIDLEHRKPYMQLHMLDSHMDIVSNRIKASADGMKNVIIVEYEGAKPTQPIYADYDIKFDKQRTGVVTAPLISTSKLTNFWKTEKQGLYYGCSVLRDYMKEMYKGQLVVLGTPTMKPHDMFYMNDTMHEMNGNCLVRAVTHHFSYDTGFISTIEPDAVVVNDDKALIAISNWAATAGIAAASAIMGIATAKYASKKIFQSSLARKAVSLGKKGGYKAVEGAVWTLAKGLPDHDDDIKAFKTALKSYLKADQGDKLKHWHKMKEAVDKFDGKIAKWAKDGKFINSQGKKIRGIGSQMNMKRLLSTTRRMTDALQDGTKAFKTLRGAAMLTKLHPLTLISGLAIEWAVETLLEQWRRNKAMGQAVLMLPLQYQGRNYTAGINGHKGMVVGDTKMGKRDGFYSGLGFNGKEDGDLFEIFGEAMNWLSGAEKDFIVSFEDLENFGD